MTNALGYEIFASWRQSLDANKLSPNQRSVLEEMVSKGEADTLETAADMLDLQDDIINQPEHLCGS